MNQNLSPSKRWAALLPRLAPYLPANLFAQLRELPSDFETATAPSQRRLGRELTRAIRSLEPLHRVLVQYMPRYLLNLELAPGQPHGEMLSGCFLFADVTGFTAMTELLSRHGAARGREAMNRIMNQLFQAVLDPLTASGGDLLIFAGDAVLAYFPQQEAGNHVLQATRAALRMQRAVAPFVSFDTEFGRCSLTISVGVEAGQAYAGVVGNRQRMELLVSGPGIQGATHAEESGDPGQVILGPAARQVVAAHFRLTGNLVVDDFGDELGHYEVVQPKRKAGGAIVLSMEPAEVVAGVELALERVERLAPFLPEDMLAQLVNTDRHRKLEAGLRPVAVQFINLVGLEEIAVKHGPALATAIFQRYFVQAQEIVKQHEGLISQIDAYSKGFFLLNTFGVPKTHEGTKRYAVSAALRLAEMVAQVNREFKLEIPLKQRGGITYGLIFSGEIGARYRRESFVGGPAVNRAARLMSKADFGQVILDSDIWAEVAEAFVGERLPAVNLKGIDGPVVIVNVRQVRRGSRLQPLDRPLVGREAEQARLAEGVTQLLAPAAGQRASAWHLSGPSGIGKTALVADLATTARRQGVTVLAGRCQPHGKHTPLFPWIDLLIGWLDVEERADATEQRARLGQEMGRLGLAEAESTLADLLGLAREETTHRPASPVAGGDGVSLLARLSDKIDTQAQAGPVGGLQALLQGRLAKNEGPTLWATLAARINGPGLVLELIQKLAATQPVLLILEDMHWADEESLTLLSQLIEQIATEPLMLVFTGRAGPTAATVTALALKPLADGAITRIAEHRLGGHALHDTLAVWISNQAQGNPLYTEELSQALQQADAIFLDRNAGEMRWTGLIPSLPLSLRELLLAHFDGLPVLQQDVLKRAAVAGSSFAGEWLLAVGSKRLSGDEVEMALSAIAHASFIKPLAERHYQFNHPLMHEAIYESLSFAQRQLWHTQIGDYLAQQQPAGALELIAYHYLRGNDPHKAVTYGLRAGERARTLGAYIGALDYYEQILTWPQLTDSARAQALEGQGDVLVLQGDHAVARGAYERALTCGSPTATEKLALLAEKSG